MKKYGLQRAPLYFEQFQICSHCCRPSATSLSSAKGTNCKPIRSLAQLVSTFSDWRAQYLKMAEAALPTKTTCKISQALIECPICLKWFINPKILNCHHSFCQKCLQELVFNQNPKTGFIICPECREKTKIPVKGVSALLNSFFLSSLIDDVINLEGPNQRPKTESSKCQKHTDQELRCHCDTCDLLMCVICAFLDHKDHNLTKTTDCVKSFRQAVEAKFDECHRHFQQVDNSINKSDKRLQLMVDRTLADILAKEEEKVAKLRNESRLLRERVTEIGQDRIKEFKSIRSSNQDKMNVGKEIVASVNHLMLHADGVELLDLKLKVMHNLTFHKELQFQTVQRKKSFIRFKCHDVTDADIGEILVEWEVKTEFGKCGEGEGEFKRAVNVACFSDGDIVVCDYERLLSTFTSKGSYKSTGVQSGTEDGKLKRPFDVVVTSNDLLLVIDGPDVKVYDRELRYIRQFRPSQNQVAGQSTLGGIVVDKKDRIAVVDLKRKVISLHNMDGSIISSIHHAEIGNPCGLSVSSYERLIFTNYHNMKLVCVDFMGNEVFNISTSIGGKPAKPLGVCCDDVGYFCVSVHCGERGPCEIHHYNASGEHIGCLARGLYSPQGMTFTPTGDLIVAERYSVKILHQ
ncbi:tripartite motif-containing protein 2-like [Asterias rubens]|uniref:tripartite motif-containing protein 2-like n=1 Tax=Asterias rubens TaxID=7604 RepID=UPI001455825E|nr:tripartite motif-containing protein 2-like [Asterias rubens]